MQNPTPRGPANAHGRNDPCRCGSGRKFKACCGAPRPAPSGDRSLGPALPIGTSPTGGAAGLPRNLSAAGAEAASFTPLQQLLRLQPRTYDDPNSEREVPADPAAAQRELNRLHHRGVQLMQARKYADAIDHLRRAARISPDNAAILHDYGWASLHAERAPEAASLFRRAIALRPDFAQTHNGLGQALELQGDENGAIAAFEAAVRLAPRLDEVHIRLNRLLMNAGRSDEAVKALHRAAAATGDASFARLCRAKALVVEDRTAEAEAALARVIQLDPSCAEAHRTLGMILIQEGRFDDAFAYLDRAIALMPEEITLFHTLALAKKFGAAERPLLDRMLEHLQAGGLHERHRMMLHFAAGKALDDLEDRAGAMQHFAAANKIRGRLAAPFNRRALARIIDQTISFFTPAFFANHASAGAKDETPVLVLGMPRSGTTLTERIISSHPQVAGGGELTFWPQQATSVLADTNADRLSAAIPDLAEGYSALLRGIGAGAARVTDKTPFNFRWIGLIHLAFPRARIIHCRRNPIDTCLSIWSRNFTQIWEFASDRGDLVFYYQQYRRLMDHWRAVLPPDRFFDVDYEGLTADPEPVTRRLIEFCGLAWDDACLRPQDNERVVKTASVWQARQPVYRTSVERWRNYEPWIGELRDL